MRSTASLAATAWDRLCPTLQVYSHPMETKHPKAKARITPEALELAQAVDSALSASGEFNHYSASHSLREIKALARVVLRHAKAAR